jgi:hypothetical protein
MIREPYISSSLRWLLRFYGDSYQLLTFYTGLSASPPLLKFCKSILSLPSPRLPIAAGGFSGRVGSGLRRDRGCKYAGRRITNCLTRESIPRTSRKNGTLLMIAIEVDLTTAAAPAGCLMMRREANTTSTSRSSKRLRMQMRDKAPSTAQKPHQLMLV